MTHARKRPIQVLASAAIAASLSVLPAWAADINVEINHSRLHALGTAAATIIVGNPSIADVSVSNSSTLVVFGRSYGQTNLIALDDTGRQIANLDVNVTASDAQAVTFNRGPGQVSYNCSPRCVRVINPNDSTDPTDALLTTTRNITGYGDEAATAEGE